MRKIINSENRTLRWRNLCHFQQQQSYLTIFNFLFFFASSSSMIILTRDIFVSTHSKCKFVWRMSEFGKHPIIYLFLSNILHLMWIFFRVFKVRIFSAVTSICSRIFCSSSFYSDEGMVSTIMVEESRSAHHKMNT
jgi:hypothetical protein